MRSSLFLACILAGATATLTAQTGQAPSSSGPNTASQALTLNALITRDNSGASPLMFTDKTDGAKHRLGDWSLPKPSGLFVHAVSIVDTPQLKIAGGLTPSPNVAAQAGAIDPVRAAMAALGGGAGT